MVWTGVTAFLGSSCRPILTQQSQQRFCLNCWLDLDKASCLHNFSDKKKIKKEKKIEKFTFQ